MEEPSKDSNHMLIRFPGDATGGTQSDCVPGDLMC
jgi:hypothetical protein